MKLIRLVGWLCLTSHGQQGHLETALPYTVPCEGREAQFLHCPHRESKPRVKGQTILSDSVIVIVFVFPLE